MSRYGHTFSRFWWLLLIPILALPAAEAMNVRHSGSGFLASMNIYVQQTAVNDAATGAAAYLSLAQIEAANVTQWLQSPTFCLNVAKSSPLYAQQLILMSNPQQSVTTDLQQHVSVTPEGDNLVSIAYSSQNSKLAMQVVQSVLTNATSSMQASTSKVAGINKAYYQAQLYNAEATERNAAQPLRAYMQQHGITSTNLQTQMGSDLTLATLYNQEKSDQQAVTTLQQQLQATVVQNSLPGTLVNQAGYYVADPPSVAYVSVSKKKELLSIGVALVLGLLFAGAFLVVLTVVDRTFRGPIDIPTLLDLPVLAVVPFNTVLKKDKASRKQIESAPKPATPSVGRAS